MNTKFIGAAFAAVSLLAIAAPASATAVNFSEIVLSSGTPLTNQYAGLGLNFTGAYYYQDNRDVFDGLGYAGTVTPAVVTFDSAVNGLEVDFLALAGSGFSLQAYDGSNTLLQTLTFASQLSDVNATMAFSVNGIKSMWLVNNPGQIGISTLTFNAGVPEPATWALMISGFGLAGASLRRRRVVAA